MFSKQPVLLKAPAINTASKSKRRMPSLPASGGIVGE